MLAVVALVVLFLWLRSGEPLTSEDMVANARQTCLELGHPPEDCP